MFTQPAPSPGIFPPLTPSTTAPASSPSSGRASRLRDLIHLRSYTSRDSTHLLHHHNSHNGHNSHNSHNGATSPSTQANQANQANHPAQDSTSSDPHDVKPCETDPPATTITDPNNDPARTHRRQTSKYSEEASEALLNSRTAAIQQSESAELPSRTSMTRTRSATTGDLSQDMLPTIRFSAFYDTRSNRPSLSFSPVSRTLPTGKEVIKVGRYSERENHAPVPINTPSAAAVGFKSKVVSRRHCEFWHEKGKWYIRDVKSSSGTFLNHIRLSAPGTESKPFPINDGDIVQLGIDFKGGEEMIYRCVKMRIELNRGWQAKPNTFNMATHKLLRDMTSASATSHAQDCSICLSAIAPCQSLFVAPCSHTWHFKCIREMLNGPSWPIFMCPNCRATADLDAEVDEPAEEWQQLDSGMEDVQEDKSADTTSEAIHQVAPPSGPTLANSNGNLQPRSIDPLGALAARNAAGLDLGDTTMHIDTSPPVQQASLGRAVTDPVPIPNATARGINIDRSGTNRTPSPNGNPLVNGHEGPITPRNDAGPWVFDGNPERVSQESARRTMSSLDAAAQTGADGS